MKFSTTTLIFASLAASSCTSDVALAWPYTPGSETEELETTGQCNAQALMDETQDCVEETLRAKQVKVKKRQTRTVDLECESHETCFLFVDNSLLCMDATNGDYHDDVGGSGNAISGVYTASNGDVQTVTGVTAEPTTTATTSSPATTTAEDKGQSDTGAAQEIGNVAPVLRLGPAIAAMAAVPVVALML
ncbi:hypothetical protein AC578_4467 [Pseudocercospora eumusae]|uniref:Uncharacterized protein n=1 Tax=Pseudocercospora eumusae TaxID=321146 RepID=A0A139HBQ1_9PEZI|nr:hypothetical protein AC578_4467 [Pseudocercospora eumusae]